MSLDFDIIVIGGGHAGAGGGLGGFRDLARALR